MSKKSAKIAALIEGCRGRDRDPHYLGYFECFNQGLFYDAHDVLEELWLGERRGRDGDFYKALIQFAGAFVHLEKHSPRHPRLRPAGALFRLAQGYLRPYAPFHHGLDVSRLLSVADAWVKELESGSFARNPLHDRVPPKFVLSDSTKEPLPRA